MVVVAASGTGARSDADRWCCLCGPPLILTLNTGAVFWRCILKLSLSLTLSADVREFASAFDCFLGVRGPTCVRPSWSPHRIPDEPNGLTMTGCERNNLTFKRSTF